MVHVLRQVAGPQLLFADRDEAGAKLAAFVRRFLERADLVLAVPRGGVPVAVPVAKALGAALDLAVVRKLPLPTSPEAGFGAIGAEGDPILNEEFARAAGLERSEIASIARTVQAEVRRRLSAYRGDASPPEIEGKTVLLVDDGLATGFTMIAAVALARREGATEVSIAVPVSPAASLDLVAKQARDVYCLAAQQWGGFAVASFYTRWGDLTDEELGDILRRFRADGTERQP